MLLRPIDVLKFHPVRKGKNQKQAFRSDATDYLQKLGYPVRIEQGSQGSQNLVIGNSAKAKYIITAHYDTPPRMLFPNFITPCNPLVYFAYQFFIVVLFLAIAFLVGFVVNLIVNDLSISYLAGYFAYLALLLLMMFGPANKNNANDNTSGVITLLEIASALPESYRGQVCFVLFDLEERGLIGSASYRKSHKKETEHQIVLNLDCVGDGNDIMMFPTKKLKKDGTRMDALEKACGVFGKKTLSLHRKGIAVCPSDQKNFPYGVGIMAFHRKKYLGLYCDRIHTNRDTILDETNVKTIRSAIIKLICQ